MNSVRRNTHGGAIAQSAMDSGGTITWTRNCAMAEQVDAGKPRRYIDRSGTINYTLNFHHHAKRVNIDRCNDVRASVFQYSENDRDCRRIKHEFVIAFSLSSGRCHNVKEKDRKRSQQKNCEGTTSEVSRTYGQIADEELSRRATEGEKET